jgi:hypothetical protein
MERRNKTVFLILVLAQGLHSIEEYIGRLWEVFPPTKYLVLFSSGKKRIFILSWIGLVLDCFRNDKWYWSSCLGSI